VKRTALVFLQDWLQSTSRKPLVLRGARQVGKTWLIRHLATTHHKQLIELNFEKNPAYKQYFTQNDPRMTIRYLEAALQCTIDPHKSVLFLDEIQAAPELISKLRWFAEELPDLPVVAAGSLLEFTLADYPYSMPVGRIGYLHIEPLSFEEFLLALGKEKLYDFLHSLTLSTLVQIPAPLHQQLMMLFKDYLIVGGMPAAVASWIEQGSLEKVGQIHYNLLATYRDDFSKYAGRLDVSRLEEVLVAIPKLLGKKFVYSHVNKDVPSAPLKQAVNLLTKAKLCTKVSVCAANGIPIGSEIKQNHFKLIFLDVGLANSLLGLRLNNIIDSQNILLINNGAIAEQITGQLLRTIEPPYVEPSLYYWIREENRSSAEVDFVIQQQTQIVPIEVKAGSSGHLKSLHVYMALKKQPLALRINADAPSIVEIDTHTLVQATAKYSLISLPFYLVGQINRLLP
jgi:predicted AAA+ superfamily ATPase